MKTVGILRDIDKLGRIVIPVEYRNMLGMQNGDTVEISVENDKIVIKNFTSSCIFCKSTKNTVTYEEKTICNQCISKLKDVF